MSAKKLEEISVAILSAFVFFIFGGIAIVLFSLGGSVPQLQGFYSLLSAASGVGLLGGILGFVFSKKMSFIICTVTLGAVDIEC